MLCLNEPHPLEFHYSARHGFMSSLLISGSVVRLSIFSCLLDTG